ncbi:hypothetical protein HPB51_022533 [Rhipicephalus microplus]|uniref:Uncharacterized protein n=1 Tax=Rhipicephalus microplus TaxID=6941 RepID=A0A9J6E431_RHIMP|nr:hypothetical protein HPB51_022533 [Rhipicephalus microplus]
MYRDALHVQLQLTDLTPGVKKRRWREYCDRIEYTANRLWSRELASLRALRPTKPRQSGVVHSCSEVVLPDYVHNTLALGPKFAVDQRRSAPELLSMGRSVAGRASPDDSDRCISEGVDVLPREAKMLALIGLEILRTKCGGGASMNSFVKRTAQLTKVSQRTLYEWAFERQKAGRVLEPKKRCSGEGRQCKMKKL